MGPRDWEAVTRPTSIFTTHAAEVRCSKSWRGGRGNQPSLRACPPSLPNGQIFAGYNPVFWRWYSSCLTQLGKWSATIDMAVGRSVNLRLALFKGACISDETEISLWVLLWRISKDDTGSLIRPCLGPRWLDMPLLEVPEAKSMHGYLSENPWCSVCLCSGGGALVKLE